MSAGYSGTPLARKLSLKDGQRVWWDGMPETVRREIEAEGLALERLPAPEAPIDAAHIFVTGRAVMEAKLAALRPLLAPGGFLWVSWPKKASKVPTDIDEDAIRAAILPATDLVDVKVCAVDSIWSGLKLMVRRDRR
ncbi:MAG: hypothetical protein JOZ90_06295 [Alphaproteobacteria bacterium]|nr:hypothetical protein [Alphaproteobacteria bacterium]MBV9370911.1 hypothetical protein [Alphaproteobacteria bacterium]MBV9900690.1 hypothetical protein [Alphaproteobacteria bacterium]